MSRTGTQSLVRALEILGFHPTHGEDMAFKKDIRRTWDAWVYDGAPFEPALEAILDANMDATMDVPFSHAYKELHRRFPDIKVLLSVRDSPEVWYKSCHHFATVPTAVKMFGETIGRIAYTRFSRWVKCPGDDCRYAFFTKFFEKVLKCDFGAETTPDVVKQCVDLYNDHIEEVKRTIPADQLLVFNVKEGWGPLCKFLDVPVPEVSFPRVDWQNFKDALNQGNDVLRRSTRIALCAMTIAICSVIWVLRRCCGKRPAPVAKTKDA